MNEAEIVRGKERRRKERKPRDVPGEGDFESRARIRVGHVFTRLSVEVGEHFFAR